MPGSPLTTDFLDPPEHEGELGQLGRYRVFSLLGLGGMGQVFRAEDTRLKRTVALKVMNSKFAATPRSRKRFIEEARSMAAVHHDNVATIFEVGQHNKTPFIAIELLQGQTLEQLMAGGREFSFDEIIEMAQQTALGLSAAHERGIVHRDIKPANLWLQTPQQRIKILDFGLALAGTGVDELSETGSVVGTLGYLAPEQASNEPVDERIDLYSLGVVMYEMCCGKLPHLASNVSTQLVNILASDPVPVRERNPKVPEPLADLITMLLQKDPSDRIPTAMKLHERLIGLADEVQLREQRQLEIVVNSDDSSVSNGQSKSQVVTADRDRASAPSTVRAQVKSRGESNSEQERVEDEEEVFELAESDSKLNVRKWLPVAAVSLLVLGSGVYWFRQPGKVAYRLTDSTDAGESISTAASESGLTTETKPNTQTETVSVQSLKVLSIEVAPGENPEVPRGNFVSRQLDLANNAEAPQSDPGTMFRGASKVAQVAISLQRNGKTLPDAPAYPQSFSAGRLPRPGKSIPVTIAFSTKGLKPGRYELVFELQTPQQKNVSVKKTPLVVIKSSQKGN